MHQNFIFFKNNRPSHVPWHSVCPETKDRLSLVPWHSVCPETTFHIEARYGGQEIPPDLSFNSMPSLTDLSVQGYAGPVTIGVGLVGLKRLCFYASGLSTNLAPFGNTLTELDISASILSWGNQDQNRYSSTLRDADLEGLRVLTTLRTGWNYAITCLTPVADTLTHLDAQGECGITDETLKEVTKLRILNMTDNSEVSTLEPFADTLTELHADSRVRNVGIVEADLGQAPNLRHLSARCGLTRGHRITVGDASLKNCTSLTFLDATGNTAITTIAPFAASLVRLRGAKSIRLLNVHQAPGLIDVEF